MEATTVDDGSSSEFAFAASVDDSNSGTSNDKSTKIRLNSFPGEDALAATLPCLMPDNKILLGKTEFV